jgi:hypothetical protein
MKMNGMLECAKGYLRKKLPLRVLKTRRVNADSVNDAQRLRRTRAEKEDEVS